MKFLLGLLLGFSFSAHAYLLEYDTLMSRTAKNHGRGGYQIQQVIQWKNSEGVPFEILETWNVLGESKMRLTLEGLGRLKGHVHGQIVYDTHRKIQRSENGKVASQKLPSTFSPCFFHFRYSKWMRQRLVNLNMAPESSLQNRPPLNALSKEPAYSPQNFVSLKRVGGVIAYGIGIHDQSSLYIEQDQFVVTQINFPSGPSVLAEDYKKHSANMYYPQNITYSWSDQKVTAKVKKITYLGRSPKAEVVELKKDARPLTLPQEETALRDFYRLFR